MASWREIREAYARGVENGLDDVADAVISRGSEIIQDEAIDEGTLLRSGEVATPERFERVVKWTAKHAQEVHDGQRPHWPPQDELREWVKRNVRIETDSGEAVFKPRTSGDTRSPREKEIASITFLVRRKIAEEGTEPVPYALRAARNTRPEAPRLMTSAIETELRGVR